MRVNGVLPSLAVTMSDSRLCDILSLVSSIPLPQGAPPPVDEDEDLHLVTSAGSSADRVNLNFTLSVVLCHMAGFHLH